ncbi:hypothetical protein BH10ACT9_BH10ACT9_56060 [soil metagenome]
MTVPRKFHVEVMAVLSFGHVAAIEDSVWFQSDWSPNVLVDIGLRIRAANKAYERATLQPRDALIGELLFDVFPDNPADPHADGVATLSASLEWVFRHGKRHSVGVQRYDIPDSRQPGEFLHRVWTLVNSPIKNDGNTIAVLNQVHDVTRALVPSAAYGAPPGLPELRSSVDSLACMFPELPAEELLGVLVHSHCVVLDALGVANSERAEALAALRLDARLGAQRLSDWSF